MTTYNLTANTKTSYEALGSSDITLLNRIQNLENKVNSQSDKLDHIVELLDELSEKKSTS
tara:strand:- start:336 stop:515 length:180 start_codon:yes stop_codon:yes gene_type:complete